MITVFTDPHLGRNAASHTTPSSRKMLDSAIFDTSFYAATLFGDATLCVGDLFHKAHNNESVIEQGIDIAEKCNVVLAGNHDLPNRRDTVPSMSIVAQAMSSNTLIASCEVGEVQVYVENIDGIQIAFIPHHATQELFEKAIDSACCIGGDIVCLHANFESPFVNGHETTLNLTTKLAEKLLVEFDYIVDGHEHNHRWEMDGRLLILGNTHPTGFSDISDKYAWRYNPTSRLWDRHLLWKKEYFYASIDVKDILGDINNVDLPPQVQFIEIVGGVADTYESHTLAKRMNELWKTHGDTLLMLRNNTEVLGFVGSSSDASDVLNSDSLRSHIESMVKGTDLEAVFKKYAEAVNA